MWSPWQKVAVKHDSHLNGEHNCEAEVFTKVPLIVKVQILSAFNVIPNEEHRYLRAYLHELGCWSFDVFLFRFNLKCLFWLEGHTCL